MSHDTGFLLTAFALVMVLVAPLSGTLSDRIGTRLPSTLGMAFLAAGLFLLSRLGSQSTLDQVTIALAVSGLGTGLFVTPNNSALMGAAPRQRQAIAAGILATARNMGMVLGVGLAGAILTTLMARSAPDAIFDAIQASFLAATGVAVLGLMTSAARGGSVPGEGDGRQRIQLHG